MAIEVQGRQDPAGSHNGLKYRGQEKQGGKRSQPDL